MPMKIGKRVLKQKPTIRKPKAYRGELLPPSVRRTTTDFVKQLKKHKIGYMVIGAVPVQFYGRERFSRDVDIAVSLRNENDAEYLLNILRQERYKILYPMPHEHPIDKPGDLLNWHLLRLKDLKYDGLLDVHLKPERLGLDETSRVYIVKMNGREIIIPSVEDFLLTKLISRRPGTRDFGDIMSTLINQYNVIDWQYLRGKAQKFNVLPLLDYYRESVERKKG